MFKSIIFLKKKQITNTVFDIYISNTGDDTNIGDINNPIKSLNKLQEILTSDKKVGFKRGDIFNGTLLIDTLSNIEFGAYGTGNDPIITNTLVLTSGWSENAGIYEYNNNAFPSEIQYLIVNGEQQNIARYPATTNRTVTGGGTNYITDSSASEADGYWNGSQVVFSPNAYIVSTKRVSTFASKVFNFVTNDQFSANDGNIKYFIQNHVNCIAKSGEYAYNNSNKTVYFKNSNTIQSVEIPLKGVAPDGWGEVNTLATIFVKYGQNISIKNLTFKNSSYVQLSAFLTKGITIQNCKFENNGLSGIVLYKCNDLGYSVNVTNNTFLNTGNTAILGDQIANATISNNLIDGCEVVPGTAIGNTQNGNGMYIVGSYNASISWNEVKNTGGGGILMMSCINTYAKNNYVHSICMYTTDMGALYTMHNRPQDHAYYNLPTGNISVSIENNLVTDCNDRLASIVPLLFALDYGVIGVYVDADNDNINVYQNFVDQGTIGIIINPASNVKCRENTVISYSTGSAIKLDNWSTTEETVINDTIENNILICPIAEYANISLLVVRRVLGAYGNIINDNTYYYPFEQSPPSKPGIRIDATNTTHQFTLSNWLADESVVQWGRVTENVITPSQHINSSKPFLDYLYIVKNTSKNNVTVLASSLPYNDYINLDGTDFTDEILSGHSAKVLVRKEN